MPKSLLPLDRALSRARRSAVVDARLHSGGIRGINSKCPNYIVPRNRNYTLYSSAPSSRRRRSLSRDGLESMKGRVSICYREDVHAGVARHPRSSTLKRPPANTGRVRLRQIVCSSTKIGCSHKYVGEQSRQLGKFSQDRVFLTREESPRHRRVVPQGTSLKGRITEWRRA